MSKRSRNFLLGILGVSVVFLISVSSFPSAILASLAAEPTTPTLFFHSDLGHFQVWLPVGQSMHDRALIKTAFGDPIVCQSLDATDNGAYWAIMYCDLPSEVASRFTTDEILDKMRIELAQDVKGVLVSETEAQWKTFPGRSITMDSYSKSPTEKGTLKARLYLVGNRLYRVETYVYNENWQGRMSSMEPFLESFYILDAE